MEAPREPKENFDNANLGHPFSLVPGARSAEKILLLQPWRGRRGEKFYNARLGHLFSLVSGARSAEKNFDNARLGHPFSLVSGARSAKKILLLQPWRAQRGPVLPLGQR